MKKLLLTAIICAPFFGSAQMITVHQGDFESPTNLAAGVQNWAGSWFESNVDISQEVTNAITGGYSIRLVGAGDANVRTITTANAASFAVTNGNTYKVTFKWRIQTTAGASGGLNTDNNVFTARAIETNGDGTINGAIINSTTTTSGTNATGTFNFTPTNTATFPKIKLQFTKDGGIAYLDDVTLENIGVLPITLTSFTGEATNNGVKLKWATASESNNKSFTVLSSANGKDFKQIGTVVGAGNSTTTTNYSFADKRPANGANYYKLTQTDADGKITSFDAIGVDFNLESTNKLSVYATQTKVEGQLNWTQNEQGIATVRDLGGKTVLSEKVALQNGLNAIVLNGAGLTSSTIYVLTVSGSTATTSVKFYTN